MDKFDVVVLGAGNAALCAALAAAEGGARVLVLERAPQDERGGNSWFSSGSFRIAYKGVSDITKLIPDLSQAELEMTDFGSYTEEAFYDDLSRLSHFRADPELIDTLVTKSFDTAMWMQRNGVRFIPIYGRQAFKQNGRFKFWGGLTVETVGGGRGLIDSLFKAIEKRRVTVVYAARGVRLTMAVGKIAGIEYLQHGISHHVAAPAVILASGGFHANAQWRARYLGVNWDLAKPRASRFSTGDGIQMALDAGAMSWGHWSGCHAVAYDRNAPDFGDPDIIGQQKNNFPLGIIINNKGQRFFDEGADFRNYIYATLGRAILSQPGGEAWQVFDQKVTPLLNDTYRIKQVTKVEANTIEELAQKMEGVDAEGFIDEVRNFNAAVNTVAPFNPNIRDGRGTSGLVVKKSNWANTLDAPPFIAFAVTTGVTFTYGGLRINSDSEVISLDGAKIPGLYATGELVGGLYYVNYPGGAGLTSGAVFGRSAGQSACKYVGLSDLAPVSPTL